MKKNELLIYFYINLIKVRKKLVRIKLKCLTFLNGESAAVTKIYFVAI